MGASLPIRQDWSPEDLRLLARREKDGWASARLIAIANALEGKSRAEAARLAGMERQALRDAVIAFNDRGPDGLYNGKPPGARPKLSDGELAVLRSMILRGPDPEKEGLSSYTLADIKGLVERRFGVTYSESHLSRLVRSLGLRRKKARPGHPRSDRKAQEAFKKGDSRNR